jgi:hypothetical protein
MKLRKNKIRALFLAVIFLWCSQTYLIAQPGEYGGTPRIPKAEAIYDNIRTLKGLPYDLVIPTMYLFADSLGGECDLCHEQRREVETSAKQVARDMIRMVSTINAKYFEGKHVVTCITCHRGNKHPLSVPNLELSSAKNFGASKITSPRNNYSADEVLNRYVRALGGKIALEKIVSRAERGFVTENRPDRPANTIPIQTLCKAPDKCVTKGFSITHLGISPASFGIHNGDNGWLRESNSRVSVMWKARLDAAHVEDIFNLPLNLRRIVIDLKGAEPEQLNGEMVSILSGRTSALPGLKLYFQDSTGFLTRLEYQTDTLIGPFPTRVDYTDYREVDGIKIPFRRTVTQIRNHQVTYQIEAVQQNIVVDDSEFAEPKGPISLR